ncbi:signal peptidase II [Paenibacillus tarimensis]
MKYYYYWIALVVFVVDYVTKKLIENNLLIGEKINILGNFFLITSHRNRGAAFGILQEQTLFFIIVTVVVISGIIGYIYLHRNSGKVLLLSALGLVLGGAFGNFLDRALYGEVVDFLQFNFGSYTFPIFNVADMGIVCGVGLIMLDSIMSMREEAKKVKAEQSMQNGEQNGSDEQQHV